MNTKPTPLAHTHLHRIGADDFPAETPSQFDRKFRFPGAGRAENHYQRFHTRHCSGGHFRDGNHRKIRIRDDGKQLFNRSNTHRKNHHSNNGARGGRENCQNDDDGWQPAGVQATPLHGTRALRCVVVRRDKRERLCCGLARLPGSGREKSASADHHQ